MTIDRIEAVVRFTVHFPFYTNMCYTQVLPPPYYSDMKIPNAEIEQFMGALEQNRVRLVLYLSLASLFLSFL